jgi:hypothetical protein
MDGYKEFLARIGTFFLVLAAFLFILFVSSDMAKSADFDYLFLSLLALGIGWIFRRGRARPAASNRFSWVRKQRESRRNRNSKEKK